MGPGYRFWARIPDIGSGGSRVQNTPQPRPLARLGTMLHRLFPHANESLASLAEISAQVGEAAALLTEMVGSPVAEYPALF